MAKNNFKLLQSEYKKLMQDAYRLSKTDQCESTRLYSEADELRKSLFAF
ncbi:MAG: Lacal_2735 family protein, partial [Cytophagales bacterium]|nr:Lacal_2735 family protein [Cytophagales bacterium]